MTKKKKKILVIDDEAVFRDALSYALNHCGYICVTESKRVTFQTTSIK